MSADRVSAQGQDEPRPKAIPADCSSAKARDALIECFPNRRVDVTVEGVAPKE